jgi:Zn-dependent M28 family amino/carboxypeptidase
MMNHRVYKTYTQVTNIIMRISNGTPQGKEHAVLVNSHVDSTLMTPGAADDGIAVGVMLECIRVLLADSDWEPSNAVIFRAS